MARSPGIQLEVIRPDKPLPAARKIKAQLRAVLRDTGAGGNRYIAEYPPQTLTASGYVRTLTLKRSWSFVQAESSKEMSVTVGSNRNIAPYNEAVQGQDQMGIFGRAGWRNIDDLVDFMKADFQPRAQAAMERAFKL